MALPNVNANTTFTVNQFAALMGQVNDGNIVLNKQSGSNGLTLERVNRGNIFTRIKWKQQDVSAAKNGLSNQETRSALFNALCQNGRLNANDSTDEHVARLWNQLGLNDLNVARQPLSCRDVRQILDSEHVHVEGRKNNMTTSFAGHSLRLDADVANVNGNRNEQSIDDLIEMDRQTEKMIDDFCKKPFAELGGKTFEEAFPGIGKDMKTVNLQTGMLTAVKSNGNKERAKDYSPLVKNSHDLMSKLANMSFEQIMHNRFGLFGANREVEAFVDGQKSEIDIKKEGPKEVRQEQPKGVKRPDSFTQDVGFKFNESISHKAAAKLIEEKTQLAEKMLNDLSACKFACLKGKSFGEVSSCADLIAEFKEKSINLKNLTTNFTVMKAVPAALATRMTVLGDCGRYLNEVQEFCRNLFDKMNALEEYDLGEKVEDVKQQQPQEVKKNEPQVVQQPPVKKAHEGTTTVINTDQKTDFKAMEWADFDKKIAELEAKGNALLNKLKPADQDTVKNKAGYWFLQSGKDYIDKQVRGWNGNADSKAKNQENTIRYAEMFIRDAEDACRAQGLEVEG